MKVLAFDRIHHDTKFTYSSNPQTGERKLTEAFWVVTFCKKRKKFLYAYQYFLPHLIPWGSEWVEPWTEIHSNLPYLYVDEETGYIENKFLRLRYHDEITASCGFIAANFEALQLTEEVIQFLYEHFLKSLRYSYPAAVADDRLIPLLHPVYEVLNQGIKTGENVFPQVHMHLSVIEQLLPGLEIM